MLPDEWKSYLPEYHFPPFLRSCFSCLGLLIISSGVLVFFVLPSIFDYISSLDNQPIIDVEVGSSLDLTLYNLNIIAVEQDSRCPGDTICSPPGSVWVRFKNTFDNSEYHIEYSEASDFSEIVSLPKGYLVRVVNVYPESLSSPESYVVRLQVFNPPSE